MAEVIKKRSTTDRLKQRTNTIDTIRDEMEVRKAELLFYEILNDWLLMTMPTITDKIRHDRYRSYTNMIHDYLPLLHEHIRLRTSEYAEHQRKHQFDLSRSSTIPVTQPKRTTATLPSGAKGVRMTNEQRKMVERTFTLKNKNK
jgi:hypothetical protein